mmetsp:Transcript_49863/g.99201  ORF Transcript_49863/g.99201 Transcript_49863/m.99201 type:complete len:226 (-) Transcript_49863:364-1041(-)
MQAEDRRLRRHEDGRGQKRAKNSAVGDREGRAAQVIHCQLPGPGDACEPPHLRLDLWDSHALRALDHRDDQPGGGGRRKAHIDIVTIHNRVAFDGRVDNRCLRERLACCSNEDRIHPKLEAILVDEALLEVLAQSIDAAHVKLVEGREMSLLILCSLQVARNSLAHPSHRLSALIAPWWRGRIGWCGGCRNGGSWLWWWRRCWGGGRSGRRGCWWCRGSLSGGGR